MLSEQKVLESPKQDLINDLLKRREAAAMANFDEQLAKLGYQANSPKPRRNHHKKASRGGPSGRAKS